MSAVFHSPSRSTPRGERPTQDVTTRHNGKAHRIVMRPSPAAMSASLLAAIVFTVLLEFLVGISFIGQGLWSDARLFRDHWFTLPLYVWFGVVALALIGVLRIVSQCVILHDDRIKVRGLFRIPRSARWSALSGIWLVRDIYRGKEPRDPVESEVDAFDAALIMRSSTSRVANLSGAFYGTRAQSILVREAEAHGVRIDHIDHARPGELARMMPGSLTVIDRHPNMFVLAIVAFYAAHNVLTFMIWGI
ncbi:hypothetical protein QP880_00325 [Dermabacter hominis]|mgnify:FL=1|uniref:hypothetical protein n=1 Tax=Dermabacter TaxID=36739 RepID=UPI000354523A|nr:MULTISPECIES: hypothetical protein [Dermabacter]EPH15349.1 hypothetical protein HMPREF1484_00982 [Dermabacter sp. HFH0086]MCT1708944.1 hypothetical protein [Dermabacter hominis]MDK8802544.1 hypothetical protein [Dermabacter hominis]MDU4923340.1 hypothetical protein [Dermabacter sp.]